MTVGVVLTGGGARGAYQAGVIKAVAEITDRMQIPLRVFTGISAGAINAAFCAAGADDLVATARRLGDIWSELTTDRVYRSDVVSLSRIGLGWIADVSLGALYRGKLAHSLLDHAPLAELLKDQIRFDKIESFIRSGVLRAVSCAAFDYDNNMTINFLQGADDIEPWLRLRRRSERVSLSVPHVMASASIPILFPPTLVGQRYFGDGSLRNTAPISPAVHLGCEKMIIIGVRYFAPKAFDQGSQNMPTMGRILGLMLNSLFFDATDTDVERLGHVNEILRNLPPSYKATIQQRPIDYVWIRPSADLGALAGEKAQTLPKSIRYLMGGLGNRKESSELTSYLLFDAEYTRQLVELGYRDGLNHREHLERFLQAPALLKS